MKWKKTKIKLVLWLFRRWFAGYVFPFDKLRDRLSKMNDAQLNNFYRNAKELRENEALGIILQEGIRKLYQKLSVGSVDDVEATAYRLTLKWVQEFESDIGNYSVLYKEPSFNNKLSDVFK